MPKKPAIASLTRSYQLKVAPEANPGKLATLAKVRVEWSRTARKAFAWYWAPFLRRGEFIKRPPVSGPASSFPATRLVTSQKDLMLVALAGQADSWTGNLVHRGRRVLGLMADEGLRHELLWINALRLWRAPNARQNEALSGLQSKRGEAKGPVAISVAATRIARRWFDAYVKQFSLPDSAGLPLQFNVNSATLEHATDSKHPYFNLWARLSTLERGRRLEIPVQSYEWFDTQPGELAQTVTLLERDGVLYLKVTRTREPLRWTTHRTDVLALDLGLRNFLASSEGDLRGVDFINDLRRYDRLIQRTQRGLQQAGVLRYGACRRYRALIARVRGFLKSNVKRWLWSVLDTRRPATVVIERLCFVDEDSGLGRTMNRLLRGFGQMLFKESLAQWSEDFGFKVVEVNAAYTSQTCAHCDFVHRRNRSGNRFACLSCGRKAHADVNAAKNQRGRSARERDTVPSSRHEWWSGTLVGWASRLRSQLDAAPPGSTWGWRLVGRARAGALALSGPRGQAKALPEALRQQLKDWSVGPNGSHLCNRTVLGRKPSQISETANSTR